jgi:branched-chain amino acid transport system substrate-binding protein
MLSLAATVAMLAPGCSQEVRVGAVVSRSGPAAVYGIPVSKGLDLALEEINAAGGFQGKPLVLIYRDDETRPEVGETVTLDLIQNEKTRFIIGAVSSPVTLAMAPICNDNEVILISPSASADAITAAGSYVYRVYPADILEATAMADFARDLGIEQMVLFSYENDWGIGLRDVFTSRYQSKFRQVVQTYEFMPGETESFATWVAEVAEMAPEAIYVNAYADDWGLLVKLLREAGVEAVILGTSAYSPTVVATAGEAAEHLLFPQPAFTPVSGYPPAEAFDEAYRAKYGEAPDRYAAYGYDALKVLFHAMMTDESAHVRDVRIGLGGLDNYEGATGRITFDSHGDVVQYPQTFVIVDGEPVAWEQFIEGGGSLQIPGGA